MRVTLHFDLNEDVTPEHFHQRVAQACSGGALRPGESVVEPISGRRLIVTDKPVAIRGIFKS